MKPTFVEILAETPNYMYCNRLVQLAFPKEVRIGRRSYTQDGLKDKLKDSEFREKLRCLCFVPPHLPANAPDEAKETSARILKKLFPKEWTFGDKTYTESDLLKALLHSPKLQQSVASRRYFMPSKWLVEQEWIARHQESEIEGLGSKDIYEAVADEKLIGVCFSGGGIRSATFNLGVIQGLAQLGVLPHVDYLSSVSGGGYIHEFLAGWLLRDGNQSSVIRELIPQSQPGCLPRAPEPIQWLKRYASYLTPARGIASADTWTMLAIWFRNTVMNQIPLIASFGAVLFLLHLLVPQVIETKPFPVADGWMFWLAAGLAAFYYAIQSLIVMATNLSRQEEKAKEDAVTICKELLTNTEVVKQIILPWLGCALWFSYWMPAHHGSVLSVSSIPIGIVWAFILIAVQIVIFKGNALGAYESYHSGKKSTRAKVLYILAGIAATATACTLGWLFIWMGGEFIPWLVCKIGTLGPPQHPSAQSLHFTMSGLVDNFKAHLEGSLEAAPGRVGVTVDPWRVQLTLLPGLLLSLPYIAIELTLGLLGRDFRDMHREWLARLRAWSVLYALLWIGIIGIALLGPYLGYWLGGQAATLQWSAALTFIAAHLTTVLGGASGKADGKPTDNGLFGYKPMDLLALLAAPIACVSLLLFLSFLASKSVDQLAQWFAVHVTSSTLGEREFLLADFTLLLAMIGIAAVMGRRVDINEFSMHTFYKNRISRCYLGAVRPGRRSPDPFTGFDDTSVVEHEGKIHNLPPLLTELLPTSYSREPGGVKKGNYEGPFPIFCTTLNLTTGEDLATQERKGTSFAFTPLYSGYSVGWTDGEENKHVTFNGYVPTDRYAYPKRKLRPNEDLDDRRGGIHVDSAVAISGAAANPNMGYNSNPALAFLMTMFNVRLGWWISNPRRMDKWQAERARATPKFALFHLFLELFGAVGDDAAYVNLSDGGHFENMGLYELVRRRCKFIIVSDAESDTDMTFGGMGMAITKCRADFGAEIDLDLRPLRKDPETGYSKAHCVVGTIKYPPPWAAAMEDAPQRTACDCLDDPQGEDFTGVIVYMKSSLVGDEPADLLAYQLKSPTFPQDSTANQWFTESMFEAYRRLGHHVAMASIQPALPPLQAAIGKEERDKMPMLFDHMYNIWYPPTPEMDKQLSDHMKIYQNLLGEMRQRAELAGLEEALNDKRSDSDLDSASLMPVPWISPVPLAPATFKGNALYATQFANSMLDFMYTVYSDLQLAFPDNRTSPHAKWLICLFRRWCRVTLLRETWKSHVPTYPIEFRLFACRELRLPPVKGFVE